MYNKNLTFDMRIRLTNDQKTFLENLSNERNKTLSEVIRSIVDEYIVAYHDLLILRECVDKLNGGEAVHGDTKTVFDD